MKRFLNALWQEDDAVLSFEWVVLLTLIVIGIVGGVAAARDAIIDELGDIAQATLNLNQSYTLIGYTIDTNGADPGGELTIPDQVHTDDGYAYTECGRANVPNDQGPSDDADDGG